MTLRLLSSEQLIILLAVVAAGLVFFYFYVYRRESSQAARLTPRQTGTLWGLRVLVAVLAVAALAKPGVVIKQEHLDYAVVPVLLDASLSMTFPDEAASPKPALQPQGQAGKSQTVLSRFDSARLALGEIQQSLTKTHHLHLFSFADSTRLLRKLSARPADAKESAGALDNQPDSDKLKRVDELLAARLRADDGSERTELLTASGGYTHIAKAIANALGPLKRDGIKVPALILLSDGRQTGGIDVAAIASSRAVGQSVRIYPVVLGSQLPLPDLSIDKVDVPPQPCLKDVLEFTVTITNHIDDILPAVLTLREGKADAELDEDFGPPQKYKLMLRRGQCTKVFTTDLDHEGPRKFRIELAQDRTDPVEENRTDNNMWEGTVNVVKRTLKVLLIASEPSREYAYMVPALLRDPVVDLSCYLQSADVDYVQQGNSHIAKLPETTKDWQRFHVAILMDVDPNGVSAAQVEGLREMVTQGGGLLLIAGRTQGLAKLIQVHPNFRSLLPIVVDKNVFVDPDRYHEQPLRVRRTAAGRTHRAMKLAMDEAANDRCWRDFPSSEEGLKELEEEAAKRNLAQRKRVYMPRLYWHHPVGRAVSGAIVLLETGGSDAPGDPLIAVNCYEEGSVMFSAIDSFWLWRYPYESYDYDRFWTGVIRFLGQSHLAGGKERIFLATDKSTYAPGEDVRINLTMSEDPALWQQLAGETILAYVSPKPPAPTTQPTTQPTVAAADAPWPPPNADQPVVLLPQAANWSFTGQYEAGATGNMIVQVRQIAPKADSRAKPLFMVGQEFKVAMEPPEKADTRAGLLEMCRLADKTGGRVFYGRGGDLADPEPDYDKPKTDDQPAQPAATQPATQPAMPRIYRYEPVDKLATLVEAIPTDMDKKPVRFTREIWDGVVFLLLFLTLISTEWSLRKWWGLL